jgi:hypothetical protein
MLLFHTRCQLLISLIVFWLLHRRLLRSKERFLLRELLEFIVIKLESIFQPLLRV